MNKNRYYIRLLVIFLFGCIFISVVSIYRFRDPRAEVSAFGIYHDSNKWYVPESYLDCSPIAPFCSLHLANKTLEIEYELDPLNIGSPGGRCQAIVEGQQLNCNVEWVFYYRREPTVRETIIIEFPFTLSFFEKLKITGYSIFAGLGLGLPSHWLVFTFGIILLLSLAALFQSPFLSSIKRAPRILLKIGLIVFFLIPGTYILMILFTIIGIVVD